MKRATRQAKNGGKLAASLFAVLAAGLAQAANIAFPSAGGDLASATDWGGTLPGSDDTVQIDKPSGNYSISGDVTFGSIYFNATGTYTVSADGAHVDLKADDDPLRMIDGLGQRVVTLRGGSWNLNGGAFRGMAKNGFTYFDGCTLDNLGIFWVTALAYSGARAYLQNGANINCSEVRIGQTTAGSGVLSIAGGSRLICTGTFYTDTGTSNFSKTLNTKTTVTGAGSVLECKGMMIGFKSNGHLLTISDNARLACTKVRIGNAEQNGAALRIVVADATLESDEDFETAYSAAANNGNGLAATNATVVIGGSFNNACPGSLFDFQNTTFSVDGTVSLFPKWGGCTVRFGGAQGTRPESLKSRANLFNSDANGGQNANNTLIFDDGFSFGSAVEMRLMTQSSNSTLRVSNGARFVNDHTIYIGHSSYNTSLDNTVEILSGGTMEVASFRLMGTDNRLTVSNGTLRATDATNGILLGYIGSNPTYTASGAKVRIQGTSPRLESVGNCWLYGDVNVRFEIPAEGYAAGFAPIVASNLVFRGTATLDVDYADYLAAGGGEATLMSFTEDVTKLVNSQNIAFTDWLKQQRDALNLPAGCRLYAVADATGSRVVFKAHAPYGTKIVIR